LLVTNHVSLVTCFLMYIPPLNRVEDREAINAFIHAHAFATLITHADGKAIASHLPVLFDEDANVLRSHMAHANEQWKYLETGDEVLCIFHGPHAYISPSWYDQQHTVPTWNYAVVHVYGKPSLVDETQLKQIVFDTTAKIRIGDAATVADSVIGKGNRRDAESDRRFQDRHRAGGSEVQARSKPFARGSGQNVVPFAGCPGSRKPRAGEVYCHAAQTELT
jgi:putative FMN-binding protein